MPAAFPPVQSRMNGIEIEIGFGIGIGIGNGIGIRFVFVFAFRFGVGIEIVIEIDDSAEFESRQGMRSFLGELLICTEHKL